MSETAHGAMKQNHLCESIKAGQQAEGTPRWVKVVGIAAIVVALLFVLLLVIRGPGGHGPRRHMNIDILGAAAALSSGPL